MVSAGEAAVSAAAPGIGFLLRHNRGGRFERNTYGAALVDKGTLGGDAPDDILGGQYRRHPATTIWRALSSCVGGPPSKA